MNVVLRFCLCLLALLVVVDAVIPLDGAVLVLDDTNFLEATAANEYLLVEFYAPWCGHCKSLAPEWVKASKAMAGGPVKLAKVDAIVAVKLAESQKIEGFPTIKLFQNGKVSAEYDGGRTSNAIQSWVHKKLGLPPPPKKASSGTRTLKKKSKKRKDLRD